MLAVRLQPIGVTRIRIPWNELPPFSLSCSNCAAVSFLNFGHFADRYSLKNELDRRGPMVGDLMKVLVLRRNIPPAVRYGLGRASGNG